MVERRGDGAKRPFPTRQQVLDYLAERGGRIGKRELARAFHISGDDRIALKDLLRTLSREGLIEPVPRSAPKAAAARVSLPPVAVLEVIGTDREGEMLARPVVWPGDNAPPQIYLRTVPGMSAPGLGDRVLARLERLDARHYAAVPIKALPRMAEKVVGVYEALPREPRPHRGQRVIGRVRSVDKRTREEVRIGPGDEGEATSGDLVVVEILTNARQGMRAGKVVERLGRFGDPRAISLIAIQQHDIPHHFPAEAETEAESALPVGPEAVGPRSRTDLTRLPLVTIDGSDARDFDDAVFAEPDDDQANRGGWHLVIAIADVAHYVRGGSALDREAYERGNSVYFPDRVVPMLPEALSNGLCSLRPDEFRACMAVHIWIDEQGNKLSHRFVRGLMRSVARLTYEQVQAAADGQPEPATAELIEPVIAPLYSAFRALDAARQRRGTLELDLVERRVVLDDQGQVLGIEPRTRLESHRLIEEFMILANVCAAETLEAVHRPCMYRIHDQPTPEKLAALGEILSTLNLRLAKGQVILPRIFTHLLAKVAGQPEAPLVNEMVLRTQSQAQYSPDNIGHFGLALPRYAHFTSPIRRYADLLVHRALISGLELGPDGLDATFTHDWFAEAGGHISGTERRAAQAEREVVDRYTAAYLAGAVGNRFTGRVVGVTKAGLFVALDQTGADGLLPMRALPQDYYVHEQSLQRLVGSRNGRVFSLGQRVSVLLTEADPVIGGVLFALAPPSDDDPPESPTLPVGVRPHRGTVATVSRRGNRSRPKRRK